MQGFSSGIISSFAFTYKGSVEVSLLDSSRACSSARTSSNVKPAASSAGSSPVLSMSGEAISSTDTTSEELSLK